jgi:hypothetical protein
MLEVWGLSKLLGEVKKSLFDSVLPNINAIQKIVEEE